MKKVIRALALLMSGAVCISSAYAAAFIYDIDEYVQNNGTNTFVDSFSDGLEPPAGPLSGFDYWVLGSFTGGRESGGVLTLDSVDGYGEDMELYCALRDSDYYFADGAGGHLSGSFEINDGLWSNSIFGLTIDNWGHDGSGTFPTYFENANIGLIIDSAGSVFAGWGNNTWDDSLNEINNDFWEDITAAFGSNTRVTMTLSLDGANRLTATWDYGSDGTVDLEKSGYASMDLGFGVYSGAFVAFAPSVITSADPVPQRHVYGLGQNHPNPFNPSTRIRFHLPQAMDYSLLIYNYAGRLVDEVRGRGHQGANAVVWDAQGGTLASGVYIYQLEAGTFRESRRMVLIK